MARGASNLIRALHDAGQVDGMIVLGGSMGTDLALDAAAALPLGVPKFVVSTIAYSHLLPPERIAPDLMMIPALKALSNLPVIYDPSHATGHHPFVGPIARAAVAAGADGLAIESHPDPRNSISDASQAIGLEETREIFESCRRVREAIAGPARAAAR